MRWLGLVTVGLRWRVVGMERCEVEGECDTRGGIIRVMVRAASPKPDGSHRNACGEI